MGLFRNLSLSIILGFQIFNNDLFAGDKITRICRFIDAKQTIYHVRQIHPHQYVKDEDLKEIQEQQQRIYDYLVEKNVGVVYAEGIFDQEGKYFGISESKEDVLSKANLSVGERKFLEDNYFERKFSKDQNYSVFAVDRLMTNGLIKKLPVENPYLCYVAGMFFDTRSDMAHSNYLDYFESVVFKKREDAVLENIPFETNDSYVVFGAAHNFADNIFEWNEKYPDKKRSLIEVYP